MELDRAAELELGARMVNAARMAVTAHLFESVRERIRLREKAAIGHGNAKGQEDLLGGSAQEDDGKIDTDDSLWQRPRTGGAGFRAGADDDDDRQPVIASARRATLVTDDDDEGGEAVVAIAGHAPASARPLPTVTARSPRTPRLPDAGGAPPHAGGARPRPAGLIGVGCGCAADRVRPVGESIWAEGAD